MNIPQGPNAVSVLLQLDNTTAMAYINYLGVTVSLQMVSLVRSLWVWALQRDISLTPHRHTNCHTISVGDQITGRGNKYFLEVLEIPKRVCQPSLMPYRESSERSNRSKSPGVMVVLVWKYQL